MNACSACSRSKANLSTQGSSRFGFPGSGTCSKVECFPRDALLATIRPASAEPEPGARLSARSLGGPGSSYPPLNRRQPDLKAQAREFAGELSELLNHTVTDGIRLRSYLLFLVRFGSCS